MDIDHDVGTVDTYTRTTSLLIAVAEPVDDSVFHTVGHILRVAELIAEHGVRSIESAERFEDSQSCAAAHIRAIQHRQITAKRHHALAGLYIFCAQTAQFFGQNTFQSLKGLGHHIKIRIHLCLFLRLQS